MTRSASRSARRPALPLADWDATAVSEALLTFLQSIEFRLGGREDEPLLNPLDDGQSRFWALAVGLRLSGWEQGLLLLALTGEVHPLRFKQFVLAHYDAAEVPPVGCVTRHLGLSLFGDDAALLGEDSALFRLRLLQPAAASWTGSLSLQPLRLDPAVLGFVFGADELPNALSRFVRDLPAPAGVPDAETLEQLTRHLQSGDAPAAQLHGPDVGAQQDLAHLALSAVGRAVVTLDLGTFTEPDVDLGAALLLWERESRLRPLAFVLEAHLGTLDVNDEQWPAARLERLAGSVAGSLKGPLVVLTREPLNLGRSRATLDREVRGLTRAEQRDLWAQALSLGGTVDARLTQLVDQFTLNARAIQERAASARLGLPVRASAAQTLDAAWQSCRVAGRQRLGKLAERLTGEPDWEDVVLPPEDKAVLTQIVEHVRHRAQVYEDWGMGHAWRGMGVSALFSGPSGTGKTLAAEVVAHALQLDLYRVDVSSMVSKFIGETEKNLRQIFDAADEGGVILLFDEADSLFGKRGDVQSSNDRFANTQVNYLLQRMESYRGLALLTTNLESGMDSAFMRRLRFTLNFRPPEAPERERIWRRAFPPQVDVSRLDFGLLGRVKLSGGNIRSVALGAAFLAAARGEPLSMGVLREAIRGEWRKLGRLSLDDSAFTGWAK